MTRVKLTCNWCSDNEIYQRFNRCYVSRLNSNSNIQFTNSETDYDWLIIINHPNKQINFPKEKTLGVIMEPSWTGHYQLRHILEAHCKHIISHRRETNPQYIYHPGLLPFHFDYNSGENIDFYIDSKFKKTKKCSMVVSYNKTTPHLDCLYKQRTDFAELILKTDLDIDIFGNGWNNANILDQRIKGRVNNKRDALTDYEFSIAIENCIEDSYFTEKITDCFLTDTTPIYYGCKNISEFFDSVYTLSTLNQTYELTKFLQCPPKFEEKKIFATKFNLYNVIVKYITNYSCINQTNKLI
jgi:hypothetical protein